MLAEQLVQSDWLEAEWHSHKASSKVRQPGLAGGGSGKVHGLEASVTSGVDRVPHRPHILSQIRSGSLRFAHLRALISGKEAGVVPLGS